MTNIMPVNLNRMYFTEPELRAIDDLARHRKLSFAIAEGLKVYLKNVNPNINGDSVGVSIIVSTIDELNVLKAEYTKKNPSTSLYVINSSFENMQKNLALKGKLTFVWQGNDLMSE